MPDYRVVIKYMDKEFKHMPLEDKRELGQILIESLTLKQIEDLKSAASFFCVKTRSENL